MSKDAMIAYSVMAAIITAPLWLVLAIDAMAKKENAR
jgi:hypothetical protein